MQRGVDTIRNDLLRYPRVDYLVVVCVFLRNSSRGAINNHPPDCSTGSRQKNTSVQVEEGGKRKVLLPQIVKRACTYTVFSFLTCYDLKEVQRPSGNVQVEIDKTHTCSRYVLNSGGGVDAPGSEIQYDNTTRHFGKSCRHNF